MSKRKYRLWDMTLNGLCENVNMDITDYLYIAASSSALWIQMTINHTSLNDTYLYSLSDPVL